MHLVVDRLVRGRVQASAALQVQAHTARAVDLAHCVDKPNLALCSRLQQHSAATIAKQHAGCAVGVVGHARVRIRTDDQNFFMRAALHHPDAGHECIHKPRAAAGDIESPRAFGPNLVLDETRSGGKHHVRRDCANDDDFDLARIDPARRKALLRRLGADFAHAQALGQHVALADPRTLHDPLVVCVDYLFEVFVGKNVGRNVGSQRRNLGSAAHYRANGKAQCFLLEQPGQRISG